MSARDRSRGPPSGDFVPHREPRRVGNGGFTGPGEATTSRAEKFEDEKRRIIQSCFSKKDSDGSCAYTLAFCLSQIINPYLVLAERLREYFDLELPLPFRSQFWFATTVVESYITHIRITEDAAYPSTPAPPNSPPENKKVRVIVVAVRRSGRVRMHKARENNDGTFSIGKTWMLDDLSAVQSYTGFVPSTPMEQQHKQWAATVGFVVTVGKPYYWHARSSKEKDFFIGSLVKIYRKYTGGKLPNLIGFDDRERQLLAGTPSPGPPGSRGGGLPGAERAFPVPRSPSSQGSRPQSPYTGRAPSRDGPREFRRQPSEEQVLRAQRSRDQMQRPSTSHSGRVPAPSPLGPSPQPLPAFSPDHRDQPPPRSNERLTTENRVPKVPVLAPPEPRTKEVPSSLSISTPLSHVKSDASIQASVSLDTRPPPLPDSQVPSEPNPVLQTEEPSSSLRDVGHNKDIPAGTPGSTSTEKSKLAQPAASGLDLDKPLNPSMEKLSIREAQEDQSLGPVAMQAPDIPPALRPASSRSDNVPKPSVTPEAPETIPPLAPLQTTEPSGPPAEKLPSPPVLSSPESYKSVEEEMDAHRPGLGPMIKKKPSRDIAGAFRKAATAYGAFRPRPGGAGERLLAAAKKQQSMSDEPDGITGVIPAPSLRVGNEPASATASAPGTPDKEAPPPLPSPVKELPSPVVPTVVEPPTVEITQAVADDAATTITVTEDEMRDSARDAVKIPADERARSVSPSPNGRRRRREDNTIKYCQALGIETGILEGRGVDFDDILTDLGWNGRLNDEKKIEDLEADIRREIGRVEATSWLGNLEQQEGKVDQLAKLIERTIEECEELEGLLTLYSHELNTLHDDVSYIETQSQGLQVQTANQKLLHNELQNLLKTLSISSADLQPLKESSLSNPDGLRDTEMALSTLYKAMVMIDPDVWQNKKRLVDAAGEQGSVGVYADTEIGQMRAIKEKKEEYRAQSRMFLQRLRQFMAIAYKVAEQKRIDAAANGSKDSLKLDSEARAFFRQELWMYSALTLFAREVSAPEWQGLINLYEQQAKLPYQNEFRDNALAWKRAARKPTGEEQELLFTHQEKEKESEGITMAARKLTVRRGKTMRAAAGLRLSFGEKQHGKLEPFEVFAGTLHETLNMISEEQNFIILFFHLSSLAHVEFPDLVASGNPDERPLPDFRARQSHDPDRGMARKVEQIMDEVYSFWSSDMQNLVDWALKSDPLQGIGILSALEKAMSDFDDTNQEFIIHCLQKLHSRLNGLFNRFVDEQIRGIEDTKVKVNKRKGVISFMRVFPHFSAAVENMLSQPNQEFFDIRVSVHDAYDRINRAMWESLKFIAKEAPTGAGATGGDHEDKEVLNYHILLIENMNHYIEEVDVRGLPVLERWRDRAHQDYEEHLKLYLDLVIHRPLGKLLEFIESTEGLMAGGGNPADISSRPSHTRSVAKKVLAMYDGKEIRRGIELLKKRVEKHFGDGDDTGLSRSLVMKVLHECERRYEEVYDRTRRVLDAVYEGQLELEWRKEDAIAMFKR
ncbi:GTP-Rho binding exocyst subunit SEC3 [Aspergillus clavatus NRRL 1]|uniref:Exocyst complex component Sec3, putative n=1 Tax=Aspergillus clavatus (strain ATCC 1007 / CBS 513.65 / DSM 816 / NCTC 3887 / NRRL 1 / QM 1276 / 107) TaxID=344612 RepID=A1CRN5_ASPCL|nr:Exocyst complex component Sec3, putative [Aspergillus clavatus NRRL 1]EAW08306.1 Exocyst complex component Sec3, putative [Aspergillus clavatus NRRL 1]